MVRAIASPEAPGGGGAPAPPFRFDDVPPADREWLRGLTGCVTGLARRTAEDLIRIGRYLLDALVRLDGRQFDAWAAAELPWSRTHCRRLVQVGNTFGPLLSQIGTDRIAPSALYVLAQTSTPNEARAYAVQVVADGGTVTHADARGILAAHRPQPDPTAAEVKGYEQERAAAVRPRGPADEKAETEADEARRLAAETEAAARLWRAFKALVRTATVHVGPCADADLDGDADGPYTCTVYPTAEGERLRHQVRGTLSDLILAAAGAEPEKWCPGCQETHPVSLFGMNRLQPDGRNRRCKACERPRLAALKKRKRRAKKAAAKRAARKTSAASPDPPTRPPRPPGPAPTAKTGSTRPSTARS